MDNFIFSLNATVPIFVVIFVGWLLKQKGMLTEEFVNVSNKFCFKIALPILLLRDISSAKIKEEFNLTFVLYCAIVTTICFFAIWIFAEIFVKEKESIGAFVQASYRGSAAVLGIAFILNIYSDVGMAPMMIVSAVPLYNIYAVIILSLKGEGAKADKKQLKATFLNICKNPIILGILLGLVLSLLEVDFPVIVDKTLSNFSALSTPLALLSIGAGFNHKKALAKVKYVVMTSVIKLVLQPAIFLPLAVMLGLREKELVAVIIMLGSPTTASCYIMAKNMNNDADLTAGSILVSTLFSTFTITFWIYMAKSMGYI